MYIKYIILTLFLSIIVSCTQKEKTAYILNQRVFDEFEGTRELQKKLKKTEDSQKYMFDSLSIDLKLLSNKNDAKSKALYQHKQVYAQKLYSEIYTSNREMIAKQEADLWKQINQYTTEYGKKNGYTYTFGTSGEGSLMYADTSNNITNDLIQFINQRYAGKRLVFSLAFLILGLLSCTKRLDSKEYTAWVRNPKNGFLKNKEIGELKVECMYKPTDYSLLEQFSDSLTFENLVKQKRHDLDQMIYMDLELSLKEGDLIESTAANMEEVQQLMYYYSFAFARDLTITTQKDTSTCELFHFIRTYKVGNKRKFLLGFPRKESFKESDLTLNIDSEPLGVGTIKITFNLKDIQSLPVLKI